MSQQSSFTDLEYANRRHRTKREDFLNAMDAAHVSHAELVQPF